MDGLGLVVDHDLLSEEMGRNGVLEVGEGCRLMLVVDYLEDIIF